MLNRRQTNCLPSCNQRLLDTTRAAKLTVNIPMITDDVSIVCLQLVTLR